MKISLAIDNCFAMKRWIQPNEWMELAKSMDLHFIEASADNEIDPLYSTPQHLTQWIQAVGQASRETGVRVANLYSGHGTYCTLGLAHPDPAVRGHIKNDWMMPMMSQAAAVGAGLGFYVHAFCERVLNDPALYEKTYATLIQDLRDLAQHAANVGMGPFGIEQMYSPHQIPWTVQGAQDFLARTNDNTGGAPVYLTLDTGHQSGQRRFLAPGAEQLRECYDAIQLERTSDVYLGTRAHYLAFAQKIKKGMPFADFCEEVEAFVQTHPYLFSRYEDGDPYQWLEALGCYSPIVHLQQTDGTFSAHKSFTPANNARGIITPTRVLEAIHRSTQRETVAGQPKVDHVYLTLEIFLSTACDSRIAVEEIEQSAQYWRQFVPRDGMELEELLGCAPAGAK